MEPIVGRQAQIAKVLSASPPFRPNTARPFAPYRMFSVVLGLIFLTTAILKSRFIGTAFLSPLDLTLTASIELLLAECEFVLGVCLVSGIVPRICWRFTVLLLGAFAVASFYKVFVGARSCGCAGNIEISPWYSLAFNFVALGVLTFW